MRHGPGDRAPGRRDDPEPAGEQDGRDDDAGRVQDRGERVEDEAPVGDEDLAERDRRGEHDLGDAVDPHHLDGQLAGGRVEAAPDLLGQPRRGEEDQDARDGHDRTAPVSTVRPKSLATASSPVSWRRLLKIGTNGAVRPAATRTSRAISGIRNAAL